MHKWLEINRSSFLRFKDAKHVTVQGNPSMTTQRGRLHRRLRLLAVVAWGFLMLPALQVAYVGVADPPTTAPMILRWIKGQASVCRWTAIEQVPEDFLTCVWVAEDQRFFEHAGFDLEEIKAARVDARKNGTPTRGASTITQQCARSLFLWQGRSWVRKGLEAYYTLWMETFLSKRRILELYVNVIETGDGVYGIEAGAKHHYGVSARELNLDQAAMLAAILPSPKWWDPNNPSARVQIRKTNILEWAEHAKLPADKIK